MKTKNGLKRTFSILLAVLMLLTSAPLAGLANLDWDGLFASKAKASSEGTYCDMIPNGERFDISYAESDNPGTYRLTPETSGIYVISVFLNSGSKYSIYRLTEWGGTFDSEEDNSYSCYFEQGNTYYFEFSGEKNQLDAEASVVRVENSVTSIHEIDDVKSVSFEQGYDLVAGVDSSDNDILNAVVARVEFEDGEIFDYYFGYRYSSLRGSDNLYQTSVNLGDLFFPSDDAGLKVSGYIGDLNTPGKIKVDLQTDDISAEFGKIELKNSSLEMDVVESPVKSIEYTGEDVEINFRTSLNRTDYIYNEELGQSEEVNYGAFEAYERPNLIKINYADGTSTIPDGRSGTVFDGYEICEYIGTVPAPCLEMHLNSRHTLSFVSNQVLNPWTVGNTYPVTVEYMGKSTSYNVKIVDNPSTVSEKERTRFYLDVGETAVFTFTPTKTGAYNLYDYYNDVYYSYELTCHDALGNEISKRSFFDNSDEDYQVYVDGFALQKNETYMFEFKNNGTVMDVFDIDPTFISAACIHPDVTEVAETPATCTENGYTAGVYCNSCEEWVEGHKVIRSQHTDEDGDGLCDSCGQLTELIISVGQTVNVDVAAGEIVYLRFVPEQSGTYVFTSNTDKDTYGYLFDSEKREITYNDDGGDSNFSITHYLTAGTVYYWGAAFYDKSVGGSYPVSLSVLTTCAHDDTEEKDETPATCTEDGYTAGVYCTVCNTWLSGHEVIEPHHTDEDGDNICDVCGNKVALSISVNQTLTVDVAAGETVYLRFVPEESETYVFTSNSDKDTYGYLFDSEKNEIASNDGGGENRNFKVKYELDAGIVYYWGAKYYNSEDSGSFEVSLSTVCDHMDTEERDETPATCTENGYTAGVYCGECDLWISGHKLIKAHHTDEDGDDVCDVCGLEISPVTGRIFDYEENEIGTYSLRLNGEMIVTGTGRAEDFENISEIRDGIKSLVIGDGITSVRGFRDCKNLESVTFSDSVTSIGCSAFENCTGLTDITIPNSVTSIDESAFENCTGLTVITIPNSVTSIEYLAFAGCTSLTSITISNSVTNISSGAFSGCTALESISVEGGNTVYHSQGDCLIKTESKELVLGCKNSVIPDDGSVTSIGYSAFRDCVGLTGIAIPSSVESIESYAFYGCKNLKSVIISNGLKGAGRYAFCDCTGLTSITIPSSVTDIDYAALPGL